MVEPAKKGYHILVVDDEPTVRNAFSLMLRHHGHTVEMAEDGQAAIARLEPGRFHLVITDYQMPGMKGDQLAALIKQRLPDVPVIMATAFPDHVIINGKLNRNVDNLLIKPFLVADLVAAVASVMSRSVKS